MLTPSYQPGANVFADMTLSKGLLHAADEDTKQLIYSLMRRLASVRPQQDRLREWSDRADGLYYPEVMTAGGADLWPDDPSAKLPGRTHVSINIPSVYVDIPAALQAVSPVENMLATDTNEEARGAAADIERLYSAWKQEEDWELKFHKAITVKELYGLTAGRVYWDDEGDDAHPCVEIVEQPKNLHLGYKTDAYEEVEWAAYVTRYEPNALVEAFGVDVVPFQQEDGQFLPLVRGVQTVGESFPDNWDATPQRAWLAMGDSRVEVWDYWYRQPVWRGMKFVRMDTFNVVIAGNLIIRGPLKYAEYGGELPYLPLYNTFVPGLPSGRPALYDIEHLLREKMERVTAGSQMIHNAVAGDMWQLVGPEAPMQVPQGLKPARNRVIAPGPNARIEAITPFIAQFQLEQYLGRIDRETAAVSGLNDLLLGLAPSTVLNSSKAINALIANYESRLSIRRKLLYKWRRDVWTRVLKVWAAKDKGVKQIVGKGAGFLDIVDPSLSPRDEQETAMRVSNLVSAKLLSQARGMDMIGVDDPETEKDLIREESTDATLWPERVQIMAQLMGALQSLGLQPPAGAQAQAQGQMTSGQNDLRTALGGQTPVNPVGGPGPGGAPEDMGMTPPIPGMPPEAGGPQPPFAQAQGGQDQPALMQSMIQGGKVKGRILTQQKLGRR
jgi:hypothetical protein